MRPRPLGAKPEPPRWGLRLAPTAHKFCPMTLGTEDTVLGCSDCGDTVAPQSDRAYAFGTDGVLCMECSVRRGGAWDEARDAWSVPPRVDDLLLREGTDHLSI